MVAEVPGISLETKIMVITVTAICRMLVVC